MLEKNNGELMKGLKDNEFEQYVALIQSMCVDYVMNKNKEHSLTKETMVANLKTMAMNMEKLLRN